MASKITVRKAQASEASFAGEMMLASLGGFGTYLIGLGDEKRAEKVLADYFRLSTNRYSCQYAYTAVKDSEISGLMIAFPGKELSKLNRNTNMQMLKVYSFVEVCRFVLRTLILHDEEEVGPDEFYIANLAVSEHYRRKGIGRKLLVYAQDLAIKEELGKIALLAEIENKAAIGLYKKFGFTIVKEFEHPHHMALTGSPGYVKMIKGL